jgi:hypothetical protein
MEIGRMNKDYEMGITRNSSRTMQGFMSHSFWKDYEDWREDRTGFWLSYPTVHVYKPKLARVMKDTGYWYSGFSQAQKLGYGLLNYLFIYDRCPTVERLVKSNANRFIGDMRTYIYDRYINMLNNATKKQISQIIKNDLNPGESEILIAANVSNPDIDLIRLMHGANYTESYESAKKIKRVLNYIRTCNKHTEKKINYRDYIDYIDAMNLSRMPINKYPKDFWSAHDEAIKNLKIVRNAKYAKMIKERSSDAELKKLIYHSKQFLIRPVKELDELFNESEELHHCVRTYAKNVAFGDTNIFFVRKTEDIENPFVTLELRDKRVIQCRAKYNAKPSDEVISFVNNWCSMNNFTSCF